MDMRNSESVNQNLPGFDAAAKNPATSIVGVYDVMSFLVSMFRKSVTPVSIGYSSHSIWLPPHEMVNKPRLSPESIPGIQSSFFQALVKNSSEKIIRNVPSGSFSKNPADALLREDAVTVRKNAAASPVFLSNSSFPRKYISTTVRAPISAG